MGKGNILDNVKGLVGSIPENFSVLEEEIDIAIQFAYFKQAKELRTKWKKEELQKPEYTEAYLEEVPEKLQNREVSLDEKKTLLIELAASEDVKVFRFLEGCSKYCPEELAQWLALAKHESKMQIESVLLDQKQVFISTGLGGIGNKLRYAIAFRTIDNQPITESQQSVVQNELDFELTSNNASLEQIRFEEEYAIGKILIPLQEDVNKILKSALQACNDLGAFLQDNFVVTNVKDFNVEKLRQIDNAVSNKEGEQAVQIPFDLTDGMEDVFDEIKKAISKKKNDTKKSEDDKLSDDENQDNDL